MSRIHDALKNTMAVRPKDLAPAAGSLVCPLEATPRADKLSSYLLTGLIVVVLSLSAVMLRQWFRAGNNELKVRARSFDASVNLAAVAQPATQPASVAPASVQEKSVTSIPAVEAKESTEVATKVAVVAEPPAAVPISYKLQGIVFAPKNCSAVINGKTVIVGERVPDGRVTGITKDSVTIVTTAGKTLVLELL